MEATFDQNLRNINNSLPDHLKKYFNTIHHREVVHTLAQISMVTHIKQELSEETLFNCTRAKIEVYFCKACNLRTPLLTLLKRHIEKCHYIKSENQGVTSRLDISVRSYICKNCSFETYSLLKCLHHGMLACKRTSDVELIDSKITEPQNIKEKHCNKRVTFYQCDQCSYRPKSKDSLDKHKNYKHFKDDDIRWHQCGTCSYKCQRVSQLKRHTYIMHSDEKDIKWYCCTKCTYKTKLKSYLKVHDNNVHSTGNIIMYKCEHCDFTSKHRSYLNKHNISKHLKNEEIQWYNCDKCPYKAKFKHGLKRHQNMRHLVGNDVKWYKCELCPLKLRSAASRYEHTVSKHFSETKIKWHHCEKCSYKTKFKQSLKQHKISVHLSDDVTWYESVYINKKNQNN